MKKELCYKNTIFVLILTIVCSTFVYPNQTFAANPNISITSEQDSYNIGDEVSVTYKLDTADYTIMSVDLTFLYDNTKLDFIDADTSSAGSQIDSSNSDLTTITRKLADEQVGELKIAGTTIGGLTGEVILFQGNFTVLGNGETDLKLDTTTSKILDSDGLVTFNDDKKTLYINVDTSGGNEETQPTNQEITIAHTPIAESMANQPMIVDAIVSPKSKVDTIRLYYRNTIDTSFARAKMNNIDGNTFRGVIPQEKVIIGQMDYFIGLVDTVNQPQRDPIQNDKFYTTNIVLTTTNTGANIDITTPYVEDTQNNTYPDYNTNNSQQYNYNNTTPTGPEEVFVIIIGALLLIFYIFYSESRKKVQSVIE